jgi:hypothetical protein
MSSEWTTTHCLEEDGFPKVLLAAAARLGIPAHPEYMGREYMERGTKFCEVIVHIGASTNFLTMQPWSISATGCRLKDTYQIAARKALRYLCQMYEWQVAGTVLRYYPPLDRTRPSWAARVQTLSSLVPREEGPTVVALASYLFALDDLCDQQLRRVRGLIKRAEKAESRWRKTQVKLAKAEARAAQAESRVIVLEEDLRRQSDKHSQILRGVLLVERARRMEDVPGPEDELLEGIPLYRAGGVVDPVAPTPPSSPRDPGPSGRGGPEPRGIDVNNPAEAPADP